jgi:hypothetical protein
MQRGWRDRAFAWRVRGEPAHWALRCDASQIGL